MSQIPSMRDLARTAALKSNPYWPFSWTNRAIYHAGAAMFARTFSRDPEVSAIYVRHSMASGNWTPGSSDIDLSVILRPGIEPEAEYAFLESFWARLAALKRVWPMLGEVDLLDERELPVWMSYSARSERQGEWQLAGGRDVARAVPVAPLSRWRMRALKAAYWFYMDRFLPSLEGGLSFLEVTDRQRLARKILALTADAAGKVAPAAADLERETGPLLARVVRSLDAATSEPAKPVPDHPERIGPDLPSPAKGVISVVCDYLGRAYIVVQDGLAAGDIIAVREGCRTLRAPVFLTAAMFRFLVREYEPQQHYYFDKGRAIAFGPDPLPSCVPPTRDQIEGSLLDQIPNALLYPRSSELFDSNGPVSTPRMATALRQFLPVLMVQSGQFTEDQLRYVLPVCRVFGANEFARLQQIAAGGPGRRTRLEAFLLFKDISAKILEGARG